MSNEKGRMKSGSRGRETSERHSCELPQSSNSHLPRLPPNAKFSARFKRKFQKIVQVSERHPMTRYFLRSRAAVAFEKKRHGRSSDWWVIHPCSDLRFTWDIVMMLTFTYLFVTIPYIIAFHQICKAETHRHGLYYLNPAYVICLIDIFMSFITGFAFDDAHEICLNPSLIARHYSRGYFVVDLLSSVPYGWFTSGALETRRADSDFMIVIAESLPLLKLIRVRTLRHYTRKLAKAFGCSEILKMVFWLCILTALIFHWSACVTYAYPCFAMHAIPIGIERASYDLSSDFTTYLSSLNIGVSNLVGSSLIESKSSTDVDKTIRCTLLLCGTGYTIYLIVRALEVIERLNKSEFDYESMMDRLEEYARDQNLSPGLKRRLVEYHEMKYRGNYVEENLIFHALSKHMKQEINARSARGLFEIAPMFHNLSKALLDNLAGVLKPVMFLPEDEVFVAGDPGDFMYFIASGSVAVIDYVGHEICHLKDGDCFGETVMIYADRRRNVSIIALEVCELLRLDHRDFKRLVTPETELYARLANIANTRLAQMTVSTDDR